MATDAKLQATATPRGATPVVSAPAHIAAPAAELVRAGRKSAGLWQDAWRTVAA